MAILLNMARITTQTKRKSFRSKRTLTLSRYYLTDLQIPYVPCQQSQNKRTETVYTWHVGGLSAAPCTSDGLQCEVANRTWVHRSSVVGKIGKWRGPFRVIEEVKESSTPRVSSQHQYEDMHCAVHQSCLYLHTERHQTDVDIITQTNTHTNSDRHQRPAWGRMHPGNCEKNY